MFTDCKIRKSRATHLSSMQTKFLSFSPLSVAGDVSFYESIKLHSKTMDAIIAVSKYIGN